MTKNRFKHSEFQQDDGQYQYYGIEDTEKNFVYNVVGEELEMYDVSEKLLIKILNELDSENKELKEINQDHQDHISLLEEEKINLQIKLQKIRDYAMEDGEVKQGVIEKVVFE